MVSPIPPVKFQESPVFFFFPLKNPKNFLPVTKKEGNKKAGYQVSILCLDFFCLAITLYFSLPVAPPGQQTTAKMSFPATVQQHSYLFLS